MILRKTAAFATIVMVLLMIPSAVSAQVQPVYIEDIQDSGVDEDGDGLYEWLVLTVELDFEVAGSYYVVGSMADRVLLTEGQSFKHFDHGITTVELRFDGEDLFKGMRSGPYQVEVQVIGVDQELINREHTTQYYDFTQFEHQVADTDESPSFSQVRLDADDSLLFETTNLTTKVSIHSPEITYFYKDGTEDQASFKVTFPTLVAYANKDAEDLGFNPEVDQLVMEADLFECNWDFIGIISARFDFSVETTAVLEHGGDSYPVGVNLIFPSTGFKEDDRYKFDLELEFSQPLPVEVTHVGVLHRLTDVTGGHSFNWGKDDQGNMQVEFARDEDGMVRGTYGWERAAQAYPPETGEDVWVEHSYSEDGDSLDLYLSYPYEPGVARIYHDPVIGINPAAFSAFINTVAVLTHNPLFYLVSMAIAGVVIAGSLVAQKRRVRKEEY